MNASHSTWPIHRRQALQLLGAYVAIVAVWIGAGLLLTGPLRHSPITRLDQRIDEWLARHRTPTWNQLSLIGSYLAETVTKVAVTAVLAIVFRLVWKRWLESVVICVALAMEAAAFIVVTWVVGRPRPNVPRLDSSPVGSSFPSGHVSAAIAYAAIAVIVFWHTRRMWARVTAVVVVSVIPPIVGLARMYRGMHFLTDVVAGALLGTAAVVATVMIIRRSPEAAVAVPDTPAAAAEMPGRPQPAMAQSINEISGAPVA